MDELREKLAALDCKSCYSRSGIKYKPCSLGYILGKCPGYYNFTDQILALIKKAGYVKLAENQEIDIPDMVFSSAEAKACGFTKRSFSEARWRKVEL